MNEKGLVVLSLQLDATKYNESDRGRPFLNEAQFSQYALDNFASTAEAIGNLNQLR